MFAGMTPAVADEGVTSDTTAEQTATTAEATTTEEPAAPVEETPAEEPAPPAEEPAAPVEEAPAEEPAAPVEETPAEEPAAPVEETPAKGSASRESSQTEVSLLAAPCIVQGGFEIDGNYAANDCGGIDWSSGGFSSTTQGGTYQTSNKDDDDDTTTWTSSGSTPPKGDFQRVYSKSSTIGSEYFLQFGWERGQESGTGGYLIEVTNAGARTGADGTPQPIRTNGGAVFVITTQGGAAPVLRYVCVYTSPTDYPGTCTEYDGSGGFVSAVSDTDLTNPFGETVLAGAFFEIGLNVTELTDGVIAPGCPAPSAATAYVRSFTGNIASTSKNLKGYVAPLSVNPPSTCVPLQATKTATPSFVRDYDWSILKTVDPASARVKPGENATFDYTVTVTPSAPQDSGAQVTGTIHVTNPNPVDVQLSGVTDSIPGATCVINGSQTPVVPKNGGSVDITYTCTLPSKTAGTNTATVSWGSAAIPAGSTQATAPFTFAGLAPASTTDASVTVSDTAAEFGGPKVVTKLDGATVFTYERELGDDVAAGACKDYPNTASLAQTTDQAALTSNASVQVCAGDDLSITKNVVASLTRTYGWTIDKEVDATVRTVDENGEATFTYTVTATPDGVTDSAWTMTGTITVENPNDWPVTATVTDLPSFAGVTCTVAGGNGAVLPANSSTDFTYTCTFPATGPFLTGTNKATVTWDDDQAYSPNSSAEYTAQINEALWGKTLINDTITVIDDKTDPENPVTLGTATWSEGPKEFTYDVTFDGVPGECVDFTNTAWIEETGQNADEEVTVCDYADLTVTKTADPSFDRSYSFDIDKEAEDTELVVDPVTGEATAYYTVTITDGEATDTNFAVTGMITVTNPNSVPVDLLTLTDSIGATECDLDLPAELEVPADGQLIVQYVCEAAGWTPTSTGTNTASVTWDEEELLGTSGSASGSQAFDFADAEITDLNDKTITVLDDKTNPDADPVELGEHTWTAEGATEEFEYELVLEGTPGACAEHTNTAWIEETGQEAEETVELCAYQDLTVSKTATGSFDRDYDWTITKDVDQDAATVVPGDSATFEYTVTVTPTAAQDSNFEVVGAITVENPNGVDVTITLSDVLPGGDCEVSGIADLTIEAGTTSVFPYECTLDEATASTSVTNTATITWNPGVLFGTSGQATDTADVDFAQVNPTTTDATATVSDTADEFGDPVVVDAEDGEQTFTYERELSTPDGTCTDYPNTATVTPSTEAAKTASQDVEVCAPTIEKSIVSSVQAADPDEWIVTYDLTVTLAGGERDYSLGDDPQFAPGVEVLSGTAQRISPEPAGAVIPDISDDGTPFVEDVQIGGAAGDVHIYRVTWQVRIPTQIPEDERECAGPGTGFYNLGILIVDDVEQTDDDCGEIVEKVYPEVRKSVTGLSRDAETKQWVIEYTLEVELAGDEIANPEGLSSKYDLTDTLQYGVIDIDSAIWSGQGTVDEAFVQDGDVWTAEMADDRIILPGAIHTYTVLVRATLELTDLQTRTVGCVRTGEQQGLGFFNTAELFVSEDLEPQVVEACAPPVYPTIAKTATGTELDPETGLQRVSYLVTVTSPAAETEGPVSNVLYSLVENPDALPDNVELVGDWHVESVTPDTPAVTQATWDGTGTWVVKGVGVFSAQDRSAGKLVHIYRVWADLRVTGALMEELEPCSEGESEGIPIWNRASLAFGEQAVDVSACNEVDLDDVGLEKTSSETSVEPGVPFDYVLTVTNHGSRTANAVHVRDADLHPRLDITGLALQEGFAMTAESGDGWTENSDTQENDIVDLVLETPLGVGESMTVTISVVLVPQPAVSQVDPGLPAPTPPAPLDELENTACVDIEADQVGGPFDGDPYAPNCDDLTIEVREMTGVVYTACVSDTAELRYTIRVSPALSQLPVSGSWVTVLDPQAEGHSVTIDEFLANPQGVSGAIQWPGSLFVGNPPVAVDYPGWRVLEAADYGPNGGYINPGDGLEYAPADAGFFVFNGLILDPSELDFAWRGQSTVTFEVNPTLTFTVEYPTETGACVQARHSDVQIEKTASADRIDRGGEFTYDIAVENMSADSAAEAVVVTDEIPADIQITDITWPGEGDDTVFPNWESCEVTGQDSAGYGGTLECVLFGPLQPQGVEEGESAAPTITLAAMHDPLSARTSIENIAAVDYHTFGDPEDTGHDEDNAIVTVPTLVSPEEPEEPEEPLPATGGTIPWALALFGILALVFGTTLVVTRRRRGEPKPTL